MDDNNLNLFAVILLVFAGHRAGVERAIKVYTGSLWQTFFASQWFHKKNTMHVEESSLEKARRQEQRRLEESERDDGMP